MLTVEDYGKIRRADRDGMSIRAIARLSGSASRSFAHAAGQAAAETSGQCSWKIRIVSAAVRLTRSSSRSCSSSADSGCGRKRPSNFLSRLR